jgi:raffinose/stachyose/melibiose transport system permease protein
MGGYGSIDMGAMMAMLVRDHSIVLFYLALQKYIIEGVVAGAEGIDQKYTKTNGA